MKVVGYIVILNFKCLTADYFFFSSFLFSQLATIG